MTLDEQLRTGLHRYDAWTPAVPTSLPAGRPRKSRRIAVGLAACVTVGICTAATIVATHTSTSTARVVQPASPAAATSSPATQFDGPSGVQQQIARTSLPSWWTERAQLAHGSKIIGDARAFSGPGIQTFVIATESAGATPNEPALFAFQYNLHANPDSGSAGVQGEGLLTTAVEAAGPLSFKSVFMLANQPAVGEQTYWLPHLPSNAAVVSYQYPGAVRYWERVVDGTVAFVVPRPAAYDGDFATWHTAPLAAITAYDASGQVIAQTTAPRIGGDDDLESAN
jgi:hypothetical protein